MLPGAGHLNHGEALREAGGVHLAQLVTVGRDGGGVLLPEGLSKLVDAGQVAEGPLAAEQVEAVRVLPPPGAGGDGTGCGHVVGAGRQCVFMEDIEVLEVSRNDHCSAPQGVDGNRGRAAVRRLRGDVNILEENLNVRKIHHEFCNYHSPRRIVVVTSPYRQDVDTPGTPNNLSP